MTTATALAAGWPPLAPAVGTLAAVGDLKRTTAAHLAGSVAEALFTRAWAWVGAGADVSTVAARTAVDALAATRIGALDEVAAAACGIPADRWRSLRDEAATAATAPTGAWASPLASLSALVAATDLGPAPEAPAFVADLARQPRAGATAPDGAKLVLVPAESHADHCAGVAVTAALLAAASGADPGPPFLAGLAHHLHNAVLPDTGYGGEVLLGDALPSVVATAFAVATAQLAPTVAAAVRRAATTAGTPGVAEGDDHGPAAAAFHAADVLDRVLQLASYERAAGSFSRGMAELGLVHEGPVQGFHLAVLGDAGLWPTA